MKQEFTETMTIPEGIICEVVVGKITCKKGSDSLTRIVGVPHTELSLKGDTLTIMCKKVNRKTRSALMTFMAHVRNMFLGLQEGFIYEMEICNVHFPMTVKVDGNKLVVTNFLGEKEKRIANILPGTTVVVKGVNVTVSGKNLELVGQTAANIEKATLVAYRDRRVFQDGIFITSKCGREI